MNPLKNQIKTVADQLKENKSNRPVKESQIINWRIWEDGTLHKIIKRKNTAQYLKRQLFKKIIETNNKATIQSAIDYIYSKSICMFGPCQFLFAQLYKIDHAEVELEIKNTVFDFSEFDKSIALSNNLETEYQERMKILKEKSSTTT